MGNGRYNLLNGMKPKEGRTKESRTEMSLKECLGANTRQTLQPIMDVGNLPNLHGCLRSTM